MNVEHVLITNVTQIFSSELSKNGGNDNNKKKITIIIITGFRLTTQPRSRERCSRAHPKRRHDFEREHVTAAQHDFCAWIVRFPGRPTVQERRYADSTFFFILFFFSFSTARSSAWHTQNSGYGTRFSAFVGTGTNNPIASLARERHASGWVKY